MAPLCQAVQTADAWQAIDRIVNASPQARHKLLLQDLALNMRALISQRLTPHEVGEINELMKCGRERGMQTFDQSLFDLYEVVLIGEEWAMRVADSRNEVRLLITLESQRKQSTGAAVGDGISQFAVLETQPVPQEDTPAARVPRPAVGLAERSARPYMKRCSPAFSPPRIT